MLDRTAAPMGQLALDTRTQPPPPVAFAGGALVLVQAATGEVAVRLDGAGLRVDDEVVGGPIPDEPFTLAYVSRDEALYAAARTSADGRAQLVARTIRYEP